MMEYVDHFGQEWSHPSKGAASISVVDPQDILVRYPQQTNVTCSYHVMLMENGSTLHLFPTNPTQPERFCPSGKLTSTSTGSAPPLGEVQIKSEPAQAASAGIFGRWLMDTGRVLVIGKDG